MSADDITATYFVAAGQGPAEDIEPAEDDDQEPDEDELQDPEEADDLLEEMTQRHHESWLPEEELGEPTPFSDDTLLDFATVGGAS